MKPGVSLVWKREMPAKNRPKSCDAVEALARIEFLERIPDWLTKKATIAGCTSSSAILVLCWKESFPNEDATKFGVVEGLYMLSQMPPDNA